MQLITSRERALDVSHSPCESIGRNYYAIFCETFFVASNELFSVFVFLASNPLANAPFRDLDITSYNVTKEREANT